ncbi:MAG: hypothetical protein WC551_07955 [Patescibacteria group bacterium]
MNELAWSLLPAFPWEGPPLPRFLRVFWLWAVPQPRKLEEFISGSFELRKSRDAGEEIEIFRGMNGNIEKLVKRRLPSG